MPAGNSNGCTAAGIGRVLTIGVYEGDSTYRGTYRTLEAKVRRP